MRILVIGGGGREHAIVRALSQDARVEELYALPGNAGMQEAVLVLGNEMDNAFVVKKALELQIDFCVVTPDDPLANGLVDALEQAGIACFGPTQQAAMIESSKVFAKELMAEHDIPTARWVTVDSLQAGLAAIQSFHYPLVIKADGLARGKGVLIVFSEPDAQQALRDIFSQRIFGQAGARAVIEEYLEGPEVSVLALTDGATIVPLPSAMDHKRALDGDQGPNTGGMGVIAPNPYYTEDIAQQCMERIYLPTLEAMRKRGTPFQGCLFFGLMLTKDGPKALEFNARFGDPETQAVFTLLESSPLDALLACRHGGLSADSLRFAPGYACGVVLASRGYPDKPEVGFPITQTPSDAQVYFAGVKGDSGGLTTSGGRVATVSARGNTLNEAIARAYAATDSVVFEGRHMRRDIGARALAKQEEQ